MYYQSVVHSYIWQENEMKITRNQLRRIIQEELQRVSEASLPPGGAFQLYSKPQNWEELQSRAEIPNRWDHSEMVRVAQDLRSDPENSWIKATFIVNNWGHIVVDASADQREVRSSIYDSGGRNITEYEITDPQHKLYVFEVI